MDNSTLVKDIYDMMLSKEISVDADREEEILDNMAANMKSIMKETFGRVRDNRKLRLSSIGRDDRYLWKSYHNPEKIEEDFTASTFIKFLFGHLTEEMVLALVKLAGHEVTDEQKTVEVEGITGHMDCKINGIVVDVKSASSYGFKKFQYNTLHEDDGFGYIGQLKAYAHAEGDTVYGLLAFDKQNGHLAYLEYEEKDTEAPYHDNVNYDIAERARHVKKLVGLDAVPEELCAQPEADGKSGNMKLSIKCSYCPYKQDCYPNLRTFLYSTGPRFLTHVEKLPNVTEVTSDF